MSDVKSRREQYAEATRAALVQEGRGLFASKGFTSTSLVDVASAARVTRGAVYHHFANKQALYEAVLDDLETDVLTRVGSAVGEIGDPWEAALQAVEIYLDRCSDSVYSELVWRQGPVALGWNRWIEFEQDYAYGLIEQFVRWLISEDGHQPISVDTMVRFIFSILGAAGLTLADAKEEDKPRVQRECKQLLTISLRGLLFS